MTGNASAIFGARFRTAGLLAVIIWLLMAWTGPLEAQSGAVVSVDPSQVAIDPGETTRVTIVIAGAENVFGLEIHLAFDPAIVQVVDAYPDTSGVQIIPGNFLDEDQGFPVANQADNDTGEMIYTVTQLNPNPPCNGGLVAAIEFMCEPGLIVDTPTDVIITSSLVSDPNGSPIPHSRQDATVLCRAGHLTSRVQ